jgi:CheY-like chemotaxis protein
VTQQPALVLVVDDDAVMRQTLKEFLEAEGYRAATAADGAEALAACDAERPDLILLDLKMPGMDGWQFLEAWRSRAAGPRCAIVLMSGLTFIRDAPGVADFLSKPVDPARLRACLGRLLA